MKSLLYFLVGLNSICLSAQNFPHTWEGIWKGELNIYSPKSQKPVQTLEMQLNITPLDETRWSWEIVYLIGEGDIRKYELKKGNSETDWLIDEKNGIILTQALLGDKLVGSFSIENSLIINSYAFTGQSIVVEFYSTQLRSENRTGEGTEQSPFVYNHKVGNYQKAVLLKQ